MALMVSAIAYGGPRDGVKLTCPETWDGRIRKSLGRTGGITYHNGHYMLRHDMSIVLYGASTIWLWIDDLH